jgi:hypothetical protein
MRLLHFQRTFVEKMFAIHSKVEMLKRDGRPLGTTPGTTTTCFNFPRGLRFWRCCDLSSMERSSRTTTSSAGLTSQAVTSTPTR